MKLKIFILLVSFFILFSCGLESDSYIDYIPQGNYQNVNFATITMPSSGADGYSAFFTHFIVFYRIYISGLLLSGRVEPADQHPVNPQLQSDYSYFLSFTDITSETVNTSTLEAVFNNRRYYQLILEEENGSRKPASSILANDALGQTLSFDFPAGNRERPTMTLRGNTYYLVRADSGPGINFNPLPEDRYFFNDPELFDIENAWTTNNPNINADTIGRTQTVPPQPLIYTYVSMYIAAVGREYLSTIYSQPTFIGIFRLPNSGF